MTRVLTIAAVALLAACNQQEAAPPPQAKGAPPPPPPYQMRPEAGSGNRLTASDGQRAYEVHCGYCT